MEISRKIKVNLLIGLSITLLMAILMAIRLSPMENLEDRLYDYRFKIRGPVIPPENIVIAAGISPSCYYFLQHQTFSERFLLWKGNAERASRGQALLGPLTMGA